MAPPSTGPKHKGVQTPVQQKGQWVKIRQRFGRLSYRDSEEQNWKILGVSYESMRADPDRPEEFNVEQVTFTPRGKLSYSRSTSLLS